jgi:hypothetical protein
MSKENRNCTKTAREDSWAEFSSKNGNSLAVLIFHLNAVIPS